MKQKPQAVHLWAIAFWLIAWQLAAMALQAAYPHGELLLASPIDALLRLVALAQTVSFWRAVAASSAHILGGFLLSGTLAVLLAALSARYRYLAALLAPIVSVVKSVPVASFIILALIWVSSRNLAFLISALMVFPSIYVNVLAGIQSADRQLLEMAQVFRIPLRRRIWGIYIPQALPYFRSAIRVSLGLCWKAGAAAEVIGLSGGSIGERLYEAKIYLQTPDLFAWTAVIVLLSAIFERLFLHILDKISERLACNGADRKQPEQDLS